MFKDIEVTLYDIFGYLLPGAIILFATWVIFRTLFWPGDPLVLWTKLSMQTAIPVLALAYLAGHVGQGFANLMQRVPGIHITKPCTLSPQIERSLKDAIANRFSLEVDRLAPSELFELCDETLLHHDSLGEREIFTYREGFYRGNFVALALLAGALVLRTIHGPAVVVVVAGQAGNVLTRGPLSFLTMIVLLAGWLTFERYQRFAQYRERRCFLRFLALVKARQKGGATE